MFHSEVPNIFFLCAGKSVGKTSLTSFDNALLMAGVGNTNLMRVSSILPPNCKAIEPFALKQGRKIKLPTRR